MNTSAVVTLLQESLFLIIVLTIFLVITLSFGRQTITNIIFGLYLGLLIMLEFPYQDELLARTESARAESLLLLGLYLLFAAVSTLLFMHALPREYDEKMFEGFGRKFLLALAATIVVTAFSYHELPVTELITPGSPVQFLFGPESSFFWWLLAPLAILFFV